MSIFDIVCYFAIGGVFFLLFKDHAKTIYRSMYSKEKMRVKFNALATRIHSLNKSGQFNGRFTGIHKNYQFFKVEDDILLCARNSNGDYLYAIETIGEKDYITKYVQWKVVEDDIIIPSYEDYYYIRKFDKNFRFIFKVQK